MTIPRLQHTTIARKTGVNALVVPRRAREMN
jgi:hypothetical protein